MYGSTHRHTMNEWHTHKQRKRRRYKDTQCDWKYYTLAVHTTTTSSTLWWRRSRRRRRWRHTFVYVCVLPVWTNASACFHVRMDIVMCDSQPASHPASTTSVNIFIACMRIEHTDTRAHIRRILHPVNSPHIHTHTKSVCTIRCCRRSVFMRWLCGMSLRVYIVCSYISVCTPSEHWVNKQRTNRSAESSHFEQYAYERLRRRLRCRRRHVYYIATVQHTHTHPTTIRFVCMFVWCRRQNIVEHGRAVCVCILLQVVQCDVCECTTFISVFHRCMQSACSTKSTLACSVAVKVFRHPYYCYYIVSEIRQSMCLFKRLFVLVKILFQVQHEW